MSNIIICILHNVWEIIFPVLNQPLITFWLLKKANITFLLLWFYFNCNENSLILCSVFLFHKNRDENVHRFALSAINWELLEREGERNSFETLYTGFLLSERETAEKEREKEQQMIIKIEIDTHLIVKWNKQIKLGRFRQKQYEKSVTKNVT